MLSELLHLGVGCSKVASFAVGGCLSHSRKLLASARSLMVADAYSW